MRRRGQQQWQPRTRRHGGGQVQESCCTASIQGSRGGGKVIVSRRGQRPATGTHVLTRRWRSGRAARSILRGRWRRGAADVDITPQQRGTPTRGSSPGPRIAAGLDAVGRIRGRRGQCAAWSPRWSPRWRVESLRWRAKALLGWRNALLWQHSGWGQRRVWDVAWALDASQSIPVAALWVPRDRCYSEPVLNLVWSRVYREEGSSRKQCHLFSHKSHAKVRSSGAKAKALQILT